MFKAEAGPADTGYAALEELGPDNWYCQFVSLPCSLPRGARTNLLTSPSSSLQQSVCVCVCVCVCVRARVGGLVAGRALRALNEPEVSHHGLPRPHKGVI